MARDFLLFLCLLWATAFADIFYGGSMSYTTFVENGEVKVKIYFINSWKLGQGPCGPKCNESYRGQDVTNERREAQAGDISLFSNWKVEMIMFGMDSSKNELDYTSTINTIIHDTVLMVSEKGGWEMEGSEFVLPVPSNATNFDVIFERNPLTSWSCVPNATYNQLQVKVDGGIRSDTGRPNESPYVLTKQFYRLELGKSYNIYLTNIDSDDDNKHCRMARYIEAGSNNLYLFMKKLKKLGFLNINNSNCDIQLEANPSLFSVSDTFGVAVTIAEYSREEIYLIDGAIKKKMTKKNTIGKTTIQLYFEVTGKTDPPIFIPPTPENRKQFIVYIGSDFSVKLYARPTNDTRTIAKFDFLRKDGLPVNHTNKIPSPKIHPKAVYVTMSWVPSKADIGNHIICANVEDNAGYSSVVMHCFQITVKEHKKRPQPSQTGKPYFTFFPRPDDIVCQINSYCRFPVYAKTTNAGGIQNITSTARSVEKATVYDKSKSSGDTAAAFVEFLATTPGRRQICLKAFDSITSAERCLFATVENIDPCDSSPCEKGTCQPYDDLSGFDCSCFGGYTGSRCQNRIDFCNSTDACNGGVCYTQDDMKIAPYYLCLECTAGKGGPFCKHDINQCLPSRCSVIEICTQNGQNTECKNGKINSPVECTGACTHSEHSTCLSSAKTSQTCVCSLNLKDDGSCHTAKDIYRRPSSNPKFVPPTPGIGSEIVCDVISSCHFPVYVISDVSPVISVMKQVPGVPTIHIVSTNQTRLPKNTYIGVIRIEKPPTNYQLRQFDLCLAVAKQISPTIPTDHSCFHVKYDFKIFTNATQLKSLQDQCKFVSPSPESETQFGCTKGQNCHFLLYTKAGNGDCSNLITEKDSLARALAGVKDSTGSLCMYDVVYVGVSLGVKRICVTISLCLPGDVRCFQMNVIDTGDKCSSNPCKNNGVCQMLQNGEYLCHCLNNFKGKHCETGACLTGSSLCEHDSACFQNNGVNHCTCRLGYHGPQCKNLSKEKYTDSHFNGGHFSETALVEEMTCFLLVKCVIPFSITRNINSEPTIALGYVDNSLDIVNLDRGSENSGGVYHGEIISIGSKLGIKKMCIQSFGNPSNGKIQDEICFKINVIKGNILKPNKLNPYFVDPTLPDKSIVQCKTSQECHLPIWANNSVSEKTCPILKSDMAEDNGVHVFRPINDAEFPCVFDVTINMAVVSNRNICLTLTADQSDKEGDSNTKRCYMIHIVTTESARGACSGVLCYNSGYCDGVQGSKFTGKCLCRHAFSGNSCKEEHGESQTTNTLSSPTLSFGDLTLPKKVHCPLSTDCTILFSVTANSSSVNITSSGDTFNITTKNINMARTPASTDFQGTAVIVHKTLGSHQFCLNLKQNPKSSVSDYMCCEVFTDAVIGITDDKIEPSFHISSPNNGSEFACIPGKTCHLILKTNTGDSNECPELKVIAPTQSDAHVFNPKSSADCSVDVALTPPQSAIGSTKTYCFQLIESSVSGEKRCYDIHFEKYVKPSTMAPSTTEAQTTSESPPTTEATTTSKASSTTKVTISKAPITTKATATSKASSTTKVTTSKASTTTKATTSSESPTTTSEVRTTINMKTTTKKSMGTTITQIVGGNNRTPGQCSATKASQLAKRGRVECICPHPKTGKPTKVIAMNPQVPIKRLLLAGGLGTAGMTTVLGMVFLVHWLCGKVGNKVHAQEPKVKETPKGQ